MDRDSVRAELDVWSNEVPPEEITMLTDMTLIAYRSLAHPPSGADASRMVYIGGVFRTRSSKPRTVLRKMIKTLGGRGYRPGELVRRAAGLATPKELADHE
jgi:hypothetical protein